MPVYSSQLAKCYFCLIWERNLLPSFARSISLVSTLDQFQNLKCNVDFGGKLGGVNSHAWGLEYACSDKYYKFTGRTLAACCNGAHDRCFPNPLTRPTLKKIPIPYYSVPARWNKNSDANEVAGRDPLSEMPSSSKQVDLQEDKECVRQPTLLVV